MPWLTRLTLLLALLAPPVFAEGLYQVELIVFRQTSAPVLSGQLAPDDWAAGAPLAAASARSTALNGEAATLESSEGYQVLLHQAWQQQVSATGNTLALSGGQPQYGHFPIEGTLSLQQARFIELNVDLWINQFDADGLLSASERLQQSSRLKSNELTFIDHGSLGLLLKVSPL
jgi:hypothetical protein